MDECNVCDDDSTNNNSTCTDDCGVPNGDNSTCTDDCGVINGNNQDMEMADAGIKNNWPKVMSNPIPSMSYVKAAYLKLKGYSFVAIIKEDGFGVVVKKYLFKLGAFSVLTFFYDEKNIPKNSVVGKNRSVGGGSTVYVCSGFVCSKPITEMDEMKFWIKENLK